MTAEPPVGGFGQFYAEQFDRRVRWVTGKFNVGRQDAEDVVQDAMVELAPKWGTDKARDPGALLTTIIQRKVYKRWSRPGSTTAVVPLEEEVYRLEAAVADPAVTVEHRDTIRRAASIMDPLERRIVLGRARQDSAVAIAAEEGVAADAVRSAGRRMERRMAAAIGAEPAPPDPGTIDVSKYLKRLPPQQRQVFTLAVDGFEPATIGEILHITSNNARVHLCLAKKAVAGMLPAEEDAERRIGVLIHWARRNRASHSLFPVRSAVGRPRKMPNQPRYPA